jgi:hypothetical protein
VKAAIPDLKCRPAHLSGNYLACLQIVCLIAMGVAGCMALRLNRFPTKDRAYVQAFVHETHCHLFPAILEELECQAMLYERRFRRFHKEGVVGSGLMKNDSDSYRHAVSSISNTLEDLAYKARLVDNDVDNFSYYGLVNSRLRYCDEFAATSTDFDCSHVVGLIWSLAFSDWLTVKKYIELRPGISTYGHREARERCNALTALLKGNPPPDSLMVALKGKIGPRTRCVLSSLAAIFRGDEAAFSEHLHQIANSHRRTGEAFGLATYFSPDAHAFLNLAQHIHGDGFAANFNSTSAVWDPEFQARSKRDIDLSIVDGFSPVLTKIAEELPLDFPSDLFVSLRRNWTPQEWERVVSLAEANDKRTKAIIAEQIRKAESQAMERGQAVETPTQESASGPSRQSESLRSPETSLIGRLFGRN